MRYWLRYFIASLVYSLGFVTWHKPRHIWEEGISIEQLPSSNCPVDMSVGHFLDYSAGFGFSVHLLCTCAHLRRPSPVPCCGTTTWNTELCPWVVCKDVLIWFSPWLEKTLKWSWWSLRVKLYCLYMRQKKSCPCPPWVWITYKIMQWGYGATH